jgi:hypothetical protein
MDIITPTFRIETESFAGIASVGLQVLTGVSVANESPAPPASVGVLASRWAEIELGRAELGDTRRTQRLIQLAAQRGAQPNASIPQACGNPAATKAAYRFYENQAIEGHAILFSHQQATLERLAQEKIVLAVQDTTQLDYTDHPATTGLGVLNDADHQGLLGIFI